MPRPLLKLRITELEVEFDHRQDDPEFLRILVDELSHRSTDRASRLLTRVLKTLPSILGAASGHQKAASPPPPPPHESARAANPEATGHRPPPPPVTNTPEAILDAWTALEVLSPQTFRRPEDLASGDRLAVAALDRAPLPWEGSGEKARPKTRLFYQVLLGTIDLGKAFDLLLARFTDFRAERPGVRGEAILAVVVVDRYGKMVEQPAVSISSFAWGVPRALQGDLAGLADWPTAEEELVEPLDEILRSTDAEGSELPLDRKAIETGYAWLVKNLGLPQDLVTPPRFAIRVFEHFKSPEPPEPLLLNSFFLDDLATAGVLFSSGRATPNLRRYLGCDPPAVRHDLLQESAALEAAIAPEAIPPARWPGKGRHPLVLLQQAAVNLAVRELRDTGILAVNGPPGTGKTTLLRDLVAANITARAEAMAGFDDPATAFSSSGEKLKAGEAWLHLYRLSEAPRFRNARRLLEQQSGRECQRRASSFRRDCRRHRSGLFLHAFGQAPRASDLGSGGRCSRQCSQQEPVTAVETARARLSEAERARQQTEKDLAEHDRVAPGFFARLFKTRHARDWRATRLPLAEAHSRTREAHTLATQILSNSEAELREAVSRRQETERRRLTAAERHTTVRREVETARQRIGPHFIDQSFFARSHAERHKSSPWLDAAQQRARDDVFGAAMALHKAFADAAAKPLRHNLGVLMNTFGGRSLPTAEKRALMPDLWSSLFLVVPLVSTTFASVGRMLKDLPLESLGWLFVDEAGQALPQAAVGALMRTRRAVVVGDPVQIEPVVTLPDTLTQAICRELGVHPDRYNAPNASAQTLADAATPYFADFETRFGTRTVGVPLLVHRRCAEPMFGTSNAVAYGHLMVQAKTAAPSKIGDILGPSAWIDVCGGAQEKWCPEEGEMALSLLRLLAQEKGFIPDLYIVTPFVVVADNLRKLVRDSSILASWTEDSWRWTSERIGTVHTVQGREAEAVLFVLGAPAPHQTGARNWAGGQPNLLNVAVTRAKERLYVIGNRSLWREAGLFRELDARLPPSEGAPRNEA